MLPPEELSLLPNVHNPVVNVGILDMQPLGESLQAEVLSVLRVQAAVRAPPFSVEMASALLATWREAHNPDDRLRTCTRAADAVIAMAEAGLPPEQIRRYALSHVRFVTTSRDAAALM
jgi:hypothetical protein